MNIMFALLNGWEIVVILLLAFFLFGAKKLPELARGLGLGLREFKKATREVTDQLEVDLDAPPAPARRIAERPADAPASVASPSNAASGQAVPPQNPKA